MDKKKLSVTQQDVEKQMESLQVVAVHNVLNEQDISELYDRMFSSQSSVQKELECLLAQPVQVLYRTYSTASKLESSVLKTLTIRELICNFNFQRSLNRLCEYLFTKLDRVRSEHDLQNKVFLVNSMRLFLNFRFTIKKMLLPKLLYPQIPDEESDGHCQTLENLISEAKRTTELRQNRIFRLPKVGFAFSQDTEQTDQSFQPSTEFAVDSGQSTPFAVFNESEDLWLMSAFLLTSDTDMYFERMKATINHDFRYEPVPEDEDTWLFEKFGKQHKFHVADTLLNILNCEPAVIERLVRADFKDLDFEVPGRFFEEIDSQQLSKKHWLTSPLHRNIEYENTDDMYSPKIFTGKYRPDSQTRQAFNNKIRTFCITPKFSLKDKSKELVSLQNIMMMFNFTARYMVHNEMGRFLFYLGVCSQRPANQVWNDIKKGAFVILPSMLFRIGLLRPDDLEMASKPLYPTPFLEYTPSSQHSIELMIDLRNQFHIRDDLNFVMEVIYRPPTGVQQLFYYCKFQKSQTGYVLTIYASESKDYAIIQTTVPNFRSLIKQVTKMSEVPDRVNFHQLHLLSNKELFPDQQKDLKKFFQNQIRHAFKARNAGTHILPQLLKERTMSIMKGQVLEMIRYNSTVSHEWLYVSSQYSNTITAWFAFIKRLLNQLRQKNSPTVGICTNLARAIYYKQIVDQEYKLWDQKPSSLNSSTLGYCMKLYSWLTWNIQHDDHPLDKIKSKIKALQEAKSSKHPTGKVGEQKQLKQQNTSSIAILPDDEDEDVVMQQQPAQQLPASNLNVAQMQQPVRVPMNVPVQNPPQNQQPIIRYVLQSQMLNQLPQQVAYQGQSQRVLQSSNKTLLQQKSGQNQSVSPSLHQFGSLETHSTSSVDPRHQPLEESMQAQQIAANEEQKQDNRQQLRVSFLNQSQPRPESVPDEPMDTSRQSNVVMEQEVAEPNLSPKYGDDEEDSNSVNPGEQSCTDNQLIERYAEVVDSLLHQFPESEPLLKDLLKLIPDTSKAVQKYVEILFDKKKSNPPQLQTQEDYPTDVDDKQQDQLQKNPGRRKSQMDEEIIQSEEDESQSLSVAQQCFGILAQTQAQDQNVEMENQPEHYVDKGDVKGRSKTYHSVQTMRRSHLTKLATDNFVEEFIKVSADSDQGFEELFETLFMQAQVPEDYRQSYHDAVWSHIQSQIQVWKSTARVVYIPYLEKTPKEQRPELFKAQVEEANLALKQAGVPPEQRLAFIKQSLLNVVEQKKLITEEQIAERMKKHPKQGNQPR